MIFHDVEQNSEEWFNLRLGKATASNFALIMANDGKAFGEPAKKYALQLALERVTGRKAEYSFSNEHMERGQEQEPIARMMYEEEHYCTATNGGFFDCGTYGDSPDFLVGLNGGGEIKCVTAGAHFATMVRNDFDPAYKWQLVGHLKCSERDWFDFVSYCSDFPEEKQLLIYRVTKERMADQIGSLEARLVEFENLVSYNVSILEG